MDVWGVSFTNVSTDIYLTLISNNCKGNQGEPMAVGQIQNGLTLIMTANRQNYQFKRLPSHTPTGSVSIFASALPQP